MEVAMETTQMMKSGGSRRRSRPMKTGRMSFGDRAVTYLNENFYDTHNISSASSHATKLASNSFDDSAIGRRFFRKGLWIIAYARNLWMFLRIFIAGVLCLLLMRDLHVWRVTGGYHRAVERYQD